MVLRIGAALLGIGALVWSGESAAYGDAAEAVWCGLAGVGWLVLAFGLGLPGARRPVVSGVGLLLAAAGATHWMRTAHSPASPWVLYGAGLDFAVLAALLLWVAPAWRAGVAWAFPLAFAAVLVAAVEMATRGPWSDWPNAVAIVASLVGAVLVAGRTGPTYRATLGLAAA